MRRIVALALALIISCFLCACIHQHTWREATCTQPKTCTACGATEGQAKGHTWREATCTQPKTCTACGATEGQAKGHSWIEATFKSPKSCSSCWKTEGEPKKSFFKQYNFPVFEKLKNFTAKGILALDNAKNPKKTQVIDVKYSFKTYTINPSRTRAGYHTIKLVVDATKEFDYYENSVCSGGELVDYYTGYCFSFSNTSGGDIVELFDTITIDGNKYKLYYSKEVAFSETEWRSDGTGKNTMTVTYIIDIPNGYDGLILRFVDWEEWANYEDNTGINTGYLEATDSKGYNFLIGND